MGAKEENREVTNIVPKTLNVWWHQTRVADLCRPPPGRQGTSLENQGQKWIRIKIPIGHRSLWYYEIPQSKCTDKSTMQRVLEKVNHDLERKYCIYLFLPRNVVFFNQIQSCFINRLIIICVHTFNLPEDSKLWDKYWAWLTVSVRAKSTAQCFLNTCIYIITSCFPMRCENNVLHRV